MSSIASKNDEDSKPPNYLAGLRGIKRQRTMVNKYKEKEEVDAEGIAADILVLEDLAAKKEKEKKKNLFQAWNDETTINLLQFKYKNYKG